MHNMPIFLLKKTTGTENGKDAERDHRRAEKNNEY